MPKINGKDSFYFSHDCNARNDNKIIAMRAKYGAEGYGLYWMIIEILREQPSYKYPLGEHALDGLAMETHCDKSLLERFVDDCCNSFVDKRSSLLSKNKNYLWSKSLLRRMKNVEKISEVRRDAAKKRWGSRSSGDANAYPNALPEESNKNIKDKIKKDKIIGDERKGEYITRVCAEDLSCADLDDAYRFVCKLFGKEGTAQQRDYFLRSLLRLGPDMSANIVNETINDGSREWFVLIAKLAAKAIEGSA